jgi:deaminated glutathione amidase
VRIALCQITSTPDPTANLTLVEEYAAKAAGLGAELAVFPEATMACFGVPLAPLAESLDGPWATRVTEIAKQTGLTIAAGMFTPAADDRVHNTLLVTNPAGWHAYHKMHLFDAFGFAESRTVAPGDQLLTVDFTDLTLGFAICYDVRFPELFRALADRGADVIVLPASWGSGPGKQEQWELLVRARALDSTCWVLACGQADPAASGIVVSAKAPTGIGHSLAVDPYGEVRGQLGSHPDLLVVEVDSDVVGRARADIPVLANRRLGR